MKTIFNIITLFGIILLIGTAGGSDLENFTLGQTVNYCMVSVILIALGRCGSKKFQKKKAGKIIYVEKFGSKTENPLSA
jgi:hypothetical protein